MKQDLLELLTDLRGIQQDPKYHPERSDPANDNWLFSYTVVITNGGEVPVQLLSRHWVVTDATGQERHVRGPGVVGEQPILRPGQAFQYTSESRLSTPRGLVRGSYQMITINGERFEAIVDPFVLKDPSRAS